MLTKFGYFLLALLDGQDPACNTSTSRTHNNYRFYAFLTDLARMSTTRKPRGGCVERSGSPLNYQLQLQTRQPCESVVQHQERNSVQLSLLSCKRKRSQRGRISLPSPPRKRVVEKLAATLDRPTSPIDRANVPRHILVFFLGLSTRKHRHPFYSTVI